MSFRQAWVDGNIFRAEDFSPEEVARILGAEAGDESQYRPRRKGHGFGMGSDALAGLAAEAALRGHLRQGLLVVPRHPPAWIGCKMVGIAQKDRYVFEGIDFHETACMNEAHEQVSNPCPPFGAIV